MTLLSRCRLSKRALWLSLPLLSFAAGLALASGRHWVKQHPSVWVSSQDFACTLASNNPRLENWNRTVGCEATRLQRPLRSPWAATSQALDQGLSFLSAAPDYNQLRYSATALPPFQTTPVAQSSVSLQHIVDHVVQQIKDKGLPTDSLSLSLVDLTGDCCAYAAYQDQQPRYPASVVKLFWLVMLYGYYEAGQLQPNIDVAVDDEALMAHYSNNGASGRIVDALTRTESGPKLGETDWQTWLAARQTLNSYFLLANYPDLNIAHKTFPIPDLGMTERTGRDLQFVAGEGFPDAPALTRNHLTTAATARLLYEIETGQAVSPEWSDRIKQQLRHSTDPAVWQWEEPNAIAGFFGEYLPADVQLFTKLGFTFDHGRQEAAIIASPDNQTRFVLVMFANDAVYSHPDETVFPTVARYVYDQMQSRHP